MKTIRVRSPYWRWSNRNTLQRSN